MNFKIHIDLVPKTCWFSNVRSQVTASNWDKLRKQAYKDAGHRCEVCGAKGRMEAHEIWHYDDKQLIQKLHKITAVCKYCHELYHFGYAELNGKTAQAMRHLCKINECSYEQAQEYINIVYEIWFARSQKEWTLDLSYLDKQNVAYKLMKKEERTEFSKNKLKNA